MRTRRMFVAPMTILCGVLLLAACGAGTPTSGTSGNTNTTKVATATTAPTATPKPKPTSLPQITQALCQSILTVDQANQIIHPPSPATTIVVLTDTNVGTCNYETGSQTPILTIHLQGWTGPNPIPQSDITAEVNQLASQAGASGVTITTLTAVSGLGDQAEYLAVTASGTIHIYVFYVLYGSVLSDCWLYTLGSPLSDATEQSALQQCAQHVISAL